MNIILEANALLEAHHMQVLTHKMLNFQSNIPKNLASDRRPPTDIEIKLILPYAEKFQIC